MEPGLDSDTLIWDVGVPSAFLTTVPNTLPESLLSTMVEVYIGTKEQGRASFLGVGIDSGNTNS